MVEVVTVPLFVLPMGIFPMCKEPLRVFEPRYKQMLDDCVLNNSEFGYIAGNIDGGSENGWSLPAEYGVLTSAENLQEQGTNLMFTAYGEKRFRVVEIIPAALSAEDFGDVFPSVDELVERYIEENAEGKLYVRAEVEILPPVDGVIDDDDWIDVLEMWAWQIVEMSGMFRNEELSLSEVFSVLKSEFAPY
ncbi:MAG: LON peptidase substrate-binding domain-containing protein, partial [Candidatus Thermoplasmatota archaeon]|nr:LON peptidase substrate-binding domain-containing protein [Candidatus Thermoplasmatota archaeon]